MRSAHLHSLETRIEMRIKFLLYGAFALIGLPAVAQSPSSTLDPLQSGARVPTVKYESAFESYAPYQEQPLAGWRAVNDEVGRVGGHVGMFSGQGGSKARPSDSPAGQSPARNAPAAPQPHHMGH
jgi:hypothetical protein